MNEQRNMIDIAIDKLVDIITLKNISTDNIVILHTDQCCHEYFFWDEYEYRIYSEIENGPNTNIEYIRETENIRTNIRISNLFEYSNN